MKFLCGNFPKGKEITTPYTGKDTLFGAPDYAYYVLSAEETPASFKVLTVESDGSFSFGKATAKAVLAVFFNRFIVKSPFYFAREHFSNTLYHAVLLIC